MYLRTPLGAVLAYPGGWPLRLRIGRCWLALGAWPEIQRVSRGSNNRYVAFSRARWKVHGFGFKWVWDAQGWCLKRGASFALEYRARHG